MRTFDIKVKSIDDKGNKEYEVVRFDDTKLIDRENNFKPIDTENAPKLKVKFGGEIEEIPFDPKLNNAIPFINKNLGKNLPTLKQITKDELKEGGELDFQKLLGKFPGAPWAKYKGEKHLPGHSYTGANTRLEIRLDENDKPKSGEEPINRVDWAAYRHDIAYRDNDDINIRHEADRKMIEELDAIQKPTMRERIERALVKTALKAKLKLGAGIYPLKMAELDSKEIHKTFKKPKYLRKVKVK